MLVLVRIAAFVTVAALVGIAGDAGAQIRIPPGSIPPPSAPAVAPTDTVQDGSFESTIPPADNPFWGETSTIFGTPLCIVNSCGNGGGTTGPRTGIVWAWFGGATAVEMGTVSQSIIIPPGQPFLLFHLWNGFTGSGADDLRVLIDSTQVFQVFAGDPRFAAGYKLVAVNLTPFADGGPHLLTIAGTQTTTATTNFSVDDISLGDPPQAAPAIGQPGFVLAVLVLLAVAARLLVRKTSRTPR